MHTPPTKHERTLSRILQSAHRAARNCELHLHAYKNIIPADGETLPAGELPSRADYTPQQDRDETAALLVLTGKLLHHLRQHRVNHAKACPGFTEERDFTDCPADSPTPARDYHLYKAATWSLVAKEVWDSYLRVGVAYTAKADAFTLQHEMGELLDQIDCHMAGFLVAECNYSYIEETYERMMSFYKHGEIIANALNPTTNNTQP